MKLYSTAKLVKEILEECPDAREDDYFLWLLVLQRECGFDVTTKPLDQFLLCAKGAKFSPFVTVCRARRKLQENYPDLRASEETQIARAKLEQEYEAFSTGQC